MRDGMNQGIHFIHSLASASELIVINSSVLIIMQPKIQTIHLCRLCSGDTLALQAYHFRGKPGKKVYIQGNLHGAEIIGNVVINHLYDWLTAINPENLYGEICLVPGCNPMGMNQRAHFYNPGRYNSYDGQDWNRIFQDYTLDPPALTDFAKTYFEADLTTITEHYFQKIKTHFQEAIQDRDQSSYVPYPVKYQQILQSLCLDAHTVIDIHSSSNQGIDYLFTFPGQEKATHYFLLEAAIRVEDPTGFTFDEAFIKPWLALEKTFRRLGREIKFDLASWTLELGSGMTVQPNSVQKGFQGIKNYLVREGIVNSNDDLKTNHRDLTFIQKEQIKKYYAPTGGIIQNCCALKAEVEQGDPIYQILQLNKQGETLAQITVTAEKSGFIFDRGTNQAVNEGEYVLTIIERENKND